MTDLADQTCDACSGDAPKLTKDEITALIFDLPEWRIKDFDGVAVLSRQYTFKDFAKALAFTQKVGDIAEAANHHPAIITEYGKVTVDWWTHKIGGLHHNDFIMAAKTDRLYA
ncbi:4a-hydroxytetrahydrobiopterin dehydratase [Marinimicrobium alkaliphilum]|uniref:4a-hydroxytetrahydrobiopterin dehydratase n=1 Tax=Marinimicrobium alkaliphilum TaxID=2202654 RepID=UPI000DB9BA2F|nr:4a-hydroxytetrahydrobiopterin dehydratase [Marinimicrobium alkaliphilum]